MIPQHFLVPRRPWPLLPLRGPLAVKPGFYFLCCTLPKSNKIYLYRERERERARECACVWERDKMCVVYVRENVCVCKRETEIVCVRQRECVCVCMCKRDSVRARMYTTGISPHALRTTVLLVREEGSPPQEFSCLSGCHRHCHSYCH